MESISLRPRAKINVALDILGKRSDGYHEMSMVMQTVGLYDELTIRKTRIRGIELETNMRFLPTGEKNLVYQAADFLIKEYKIRGGIEMSLRKNIPVSAGLGGGSSDCAAALWGMRKLFNLNIPSSELLEIGGRFGADVPFCLMQGTVLAEGIGDVLTPLTPHPDVFVLLAKPPVGVSTASIFNSFSMENVERRPDMSCLLENIHKRDLEGIASDMCNVLESVTEKMHPIIRSIKDIMIREHALNAIMSGSGPTVFGYFTDKSEAYCAMQAIRRELCSVREIYITSTFNAMSKKRRTDKYNGR